MKNLKFLFPSALASVMIFSALNAQTVTQVTIGRSNENMQTDAITVVASTANPFGNLDWGVEVKGIGLSAPTITLPGATNNGTINPLQHNGGVLGYNSNDAAWEYGSPNFNNIAMATGTDRNARFPFGSYTVSIPTFSDVTLNQTSWSHAAPVFTLTGGTWSGGVYLVDPTQVVTISTASNPFTFFNANANGAINFAIYPPSGPALTDSIIFYLDNIAANNFISYTINANTLTPGTDYSLYGSYAAILDQNSTNGSFNAAYWEASTSLTISAIPEPSTYATFAGFAALGLAAWRRRRLAA